MRFGYRSPSFQIDSRKYIFVKAPALCLCGAAGPVAGVWLGSRRIGILERISPRGCRGGSFLLFASMLRKISRRCCGRFESADVRRVTLLHLPLAFAQSADTPFPVRPEEPNPYALRTLMDVTAAATYASFASAAARPCLNALQHYRITWDTGFCDYPPAHPSDFEQHVFSKLQNDHTS